MDESKKGKGIEGLGGKDLGQVLPYFEKRKGSLPPEEREPVEKIDRITLVTDFDPSIAFKDRITTDRSVLYQFNPEKNLPSIPSDLGKKRIEVLFDTARQPRSTYNWLLRVSHFEQPKDFVHPFTLLDLHKKQGNKTKSAFTFWYDSEKRLWVALLDFDEKGSYFGINQADPDAKLSTDFSAALQKGNGQKVEVPAK